MGRRDETVQRILDGAAHAFAKGGFAGTSMEEIAASAGVSRLLLYRDFAGKKELYQAVLERTLARAVERLMREIEPDRLMRRWAAEATVDITYQAIITWLEHGDPSRDDEFFRRLLEVNRAAAKPVRADRR